MRATAKNFENGILMSYQKIEGGTEILVKAHNANQEIWPGVESVLVVWTFNSGTGKISILENECESFSPLQEFADNLLRKWV